MILQIVQITRFNKEPVPEGFKKYKELEQDGIRYTLWRKQTTDEKEIKALILAGANIVEEDERNPVSDMLIWGAAFGLWK